MAGFFDPYPEFHVGKNPPRFDARHTVLIAPNLADIEGKTIIDAGAHNGRWAFAALMAGAKKVYCIEGRQGLLDHARAGFEKYGIAAERYELICGDVLASLRERRLTVDTFFLLGCFYHTHRQVEWVCEIEKTGCRTVIIDTELAGGMDAPLLAFKWDDIIDVRNAPYETRAGSGKAIVARPSRRFVNFLFRAFGFAVTEVDWSPIVAQWPDADLKDYAEDRRSTFIARRA